MSLIKKAGRNTMTNIPTALKLLPATAKLNYFSRKVTTLLKSNQEKNFTMLKEKLKLKKTKLLTGK